MKSIKESLKLSGSDKIVDFPEKFNKLLDIIERLIYAVSFIIALALTFLLNFFLSKQINYILIFFNIEWYKLPEGYRLLFLGLPIMIMGGILTHVINKKYIDPLIDKK